MGGRKDWGGRNCKRNSSRIRQGNEQELALKTLKKRFALKTRKMSSLSIFETRRAWTTQTAAARANAQHSL